MLGRTLSGRRALDGLVTGVARAPIRVATGRCTHARHRLSRCTRCRDACPAGAIDLPGTDRAAPARIDPERCTGCGLCIPACPTQALGGSAWLAPAGGESVFACACAGGVPAASIVPCLGAVEAVDWLRAAERAVTLYRGSCGTCPLTGGGTALQRRLDVARALGRLAGHEIDVKVRTVAGREGPVPAGRAAPRVPRRDLFRLAGREARADALAAVLPAAEGGAWRDGSLPRAMSPRRQAIAHRLPPTVAQPRGLPLWELRLRIRRCTGCGLCATLCPEQAVRWLGAAALAFEPARCDGCGLCADACPERALDLAPAAAPLATRPRTLLRGERRSCARCGQAFFAASGETVCRACGGLAAAIPERRARG